PSRFYRSPDRQQALRHCSPCNVTRRQGIINQPTADRRTECLACPKFLAFLGSATKARRIVILHLCFMRENGQHRRLLSHHAAFCVVFRAGMPLSSSYEHCIFAVQSDANPNASGVPVKRWFLGILLRARFAPRATTFLRYRCALLTGPPFVPRLRNRIGC